MLYWTGKACAVQHKQANPKIQPITRVLNRSQSRPDGDVITGQIHIELFSTLPFQPLGHRVSSPVVLGLNKQYMFSQVLFGIKWRRSVLSHLTSGSLREKALDDRREWRNVL